MFGGVAFPQILIYAPAMLMDVKGALLQALMSGDSYGLELIQRVKADTGGRAKLLEGRVYPALRELECDGAQGVKVGVHKASIRGGFVAQRRFAVACSLCAGHWALPF